MQSSISQLAKNAKTPHPIFLNVRIHDSGIRPVLWLVVAACQYRLRAGPPVRVSADCVKGGEGRGVCFAKQQWRGVSYKFLSTGWSLHGPHVVHTQHVDRCVSLVADAQLFNVLISFRQWNPAHVAFAHQRGQDTVSCLWLYFLVFFFFPSSFYTYLSSFLCFAWMFPFGCFRDNTVLVPVRYM